MDLDEMAGPIVDWTRALPRPVAFVLSGGASLGAIQVGMLQGLATVDLHPDMVVATSVGTLNGAVLAEQGDPGRAAEVLEETWTGLTRRDVFPGGRAAQALSAVRAGHLHPQDGLRRLVVQTLSSRSFADLDLPLLVVTAEVLTGHVRVLRSGRLVPALLAATALPGVFPPVEIDGCTVWDAGSVANVPLQVALDAGASSIVVLDAGDVCHLEELPRTVPDALVLSLQRAVRQRVQVEAPLVSQQVPVLYLPRPCAGKRALLDLGSSADLVAPTATMVGEFLATAGAPTRGCMVGSGHQHPTAPVPVS